MRQIVLDTETTGLDWRNGDRVIEIGCVELVNRSLTGRHYHVYINPERGIDAEAVAVHGITEDFLADKPRFADVAADFEAFVRDAELVIHNAAFDLGFLDAEFARLGAQHPPLRERCAVEDSLELARQRFPGQRNSLDALCRRLGVDNSHRQLHGALLDAQLLAEAYLALTSGQGEIGFDALAEGEKRDTAQALERLAGTEAPRPRVQVPAADLAAHEERLARLRARAGHAVWDRAAVAAPEAEAEAIPA